MSMPLFEVDLSYITTHDLMKELSSRSVSPEIIDLKILIDLKQALILGNGRRVNEIAQKIVDAFI